MQDLIFGMDMQFEDSRSFVDRRTGKVVTVTGDELRRAEEFDDEEIDPAELEEELQVAFDVYANFELYEELPDRDAIDEYEMMADFIYSRENHSEGEALAAAIQGKGAFRRFKDTAHRLGVIDEWYRYRDDRYKRKAVEWCRDNGFEYEE